MFSRDIGIDLGTANVIIFQRGRGIVIQEPAVVAIDTDNHRVLAVGGEARRMIGRTPGNIMAVHPLREGVIADYDVTEAMLKHFVRRVLRQPRLLRPQMVVCVPSGVTDVEKRAVQEAAIQAGAKRVYLISEPMAAAIGAGIDVSQPVGHLVVDVGGGTTDAAVISLGGEVVSDSIRVGGSKMDESIIRYVRREFNVVIGERTAEELKVKIGCALRPEEPETMEVTGRDAVTGLPRPVTISSLHIYEALEETLSQITQMIRSILERTPPELGSDIYDHGLVLTGGGALLKGFPELIARETGITSYLVDDPIACVARGTGQVLDILDSVERSAVLTASI